MISELKDDEILDFLMNSEFEQDYKPEELKYLLFKWKYFYRVLHGRKDSMKTEKDGEIISLKNKIQYLDSTIGQLMESVDNKNFIIQNLKNRKLSFKERITGKIITKNNEN